MDHAFLKELAEYDIALEDAKFRYNFKKEYTLRDKYFPKVEACLPRTEHLLFRYILKYEDRNSDILNTPYLLKSLEFKEFGEDSDIVFRCVNISRDELHDDIRRVPLPGNLTEKAAFLPLQVLLLMIARYYIMTEQPKKLAVIQYYYGYSIYWKRLNRQFRHYKPGESAGGEAAMIYTINECNNKVLLKKLGSLKELLGHIVHGRLETYATQMIDFCDEDIRYIIDQISTNLGAKIVEISSKYYDNLKNKKAILEGNQIVDDLGNTRLSSSITTQVETLANEYTTKFFMNEVDLSLVKQAAVIGKGVSVKELKSSLDTIITKASVEDLHDFYASLFYIFLTSPEGNGDVRAIHSLKFLAVMRNIIKKGQSNDGNIVKTRELMDKWLEEGSNTFRVTTREGTKSGYRRAIYFYFILAVTNKR